MSDFKHLDQLLKGFVERGLPGCGCAVAKEGKILYEGYHGFADIDAKKSINSDTVYRLYSMTKVIICTAAMILYERGKFLPTDPIGEYIPELKKRKIVHVKPNGSLVIKDAEIPALIKHAFSMAVGLPHPNGDMPTAKAMSEIRANMNAKYGQGQFDIVADAAAMAEAPAAFEAGTHFLYGYGHDIIAALIQIVSGKKLGDFLREEIFEPLGMNSTGYRYFGDIKDRMVGMYDWSEDNILSKAEDKQDYLMEPDCKLERGGAGLFSTVPDYLKFTQMLANGGIHDGRQIIGRKTIDLMRQNQLSEQQLKDFGGDYLAGYGYGLGVRTMMNTAAGNANTSVGEFGWTGALGTWTSIDPSEGISVVYMHQTRPNKELYHHLRVRAAAYGGIL
jgi:CubicO group peptidase (beta-lactamase class C family)